jgi:osmotically-inducible protein OsmY
MDEFYKNKDVDASRMQILVHNGIVNLSGCVRTEKERIRAQEIVCKMEHVWNVENELEVKDESKRRFFDRPLFS